MPDHHGACFYFPDKGNKPIFSYIETDTNSVINDIREKVAISNKANTGAYVFPSAGILRLWAGKNIDLNSRKRQGDFGEYYISQLISTMISEGEVPFLGMPVEKTGFSCVGTPDQLEELLFLIKDDNSVIKVKKRRFCFDIDSTLVGVPAVSGDYSTCLPITKNIELVQQLHKAGHYVIIVGLTF